MLVEGNGLMPGISLVTDSSDAYLVFTGRLKPSIPGRSAPRPPRQISTPHTLGAALLRAAHEVRGNELFLGTYDYAMNAVRAGLDRSKAKSDISSFAPQAIKMQDVSAYRLKGENPKESDRDDAKTYEHRRHQPFVRLRLLNLLTLSHEPPLVAASQPIQISAHSIRPLQVT